MRTFKLVDVEEALRDGYPGSENYDFYEKYDTLLFEFCDGKAVRYVASDGGEPEDATLYRDFNWVVDELNALAKENDELREKLQNEKDRP